jgi:hypothetical protein
LVARRRLNPLTVADLDCINSYHVDTDDLHEFVAAALPLAKPVWCEWLTIDYWLRRSAERGRRASTSDSPATRRPYNHWSGPFGPAHCTSQQPRIMRTEGLSENSWNYLRSAVDIMVRALLLNLKSANIDL